MDLVLVVLICRPLLSSQRLAQSKQSCREDWIEGRLSLMIKKTEKQKDLRNFSHLEETTFWSTPTYHDHQPQDT